VSARAESLRGVPSWAPPAALALGFAALLVRPVSVASVAVLALVGAAALAVPLGRPASAGRATWALVVATGCGAFAASRAFGAGPPARVTNFGLASLVLAGVAEEAFFRRLVYGWVEGLAGAFPAALVSSLSFAIVHLPTYGVRVLPLDVAAGLMLCWQRRATGGWSASAVTHVVANLLQMR
jgi:membrane protease YdiL (CAAX protease family)